ncbi:UDP-N-acetylmuramate:L-alanyl-gamma-D-glutamyl-meso-diaminopimelate ligase [Parasutterella secunda]|uniref:UDP-N-acetylmuramate:L-alanyl-gamma-D-glutamyl- meso-diaminopimelate ligase n=1 Tax=Parasutterella secunda TaxID=626947 RepID=UPI0025A31460|nr:UDP-N-acetylmuramate:L-alanyl-gamma-D-glutamyl-meso-diaminopimelate ligase [Parasutterella secunda]MDM8112784.1 UDP-N-acetylmuramate:L-alanyl-gamma-D-glutamyl-meso-diaminopimelate ligase [Parasutterella secunda]MDM8218042.1 UDP-N-acetylmuramate:L-alanyl-gamma-D-glutamyl-meso-diaminopimelate ligase [Parasutterella secunda]
MHVHILGICGTFMGGIAQLARAAGHRVTGCDANVYPPMSDQLASAGIELIEGFDESQVALRPDLYVIGNAISRGNPLLEKILNDQLPYTSGPQWLGETILGSRHVLAVAGTHGKTTTSSLLAWILERCGKNPSFLIGGVPANFAHSARLTSSRYFVIEADEYDTCFFDKRSKFVHYRPKTAILNNLEYDHADIFPDLHAIETQFHHLVRMMAQNARVVVNGQSEALKRVLDRGLYSDCVYFNDERGWHLQGNELFYKGRLIDALRLSLPGHHNLLNASAAVAAATHVGIDPKEALAALDEFSGVKRRLELKGIENGVSVIDDFAHHPTAIYETIRALRGKMGKKGRLIAVLEPRSNTMKMGTMKDRLAGSLQEADFVVCYADPKLGWDVSAALAPLGEKLHVLHTVQETAAVAASLAQKGDDILVMSNGGFGGIHGQLLSLLKNKG